MLWDNSAFDKETTAVSQNVGTLRRVPEERKLVVRNGQLGIGAGASLVTNNCARQSFGVKVKVM
jgi:hypothetical protein